MKQTIYRALLKLDTSLSLSGFFPLLPLATEKNCNCQLLDATSLFSLAHSLNMLCTLLFLPRACWPIISTFLSCFDCFLVAELSPLAAHFSRSSLALLIAAKKLTDIFCYCLLACPCCLDAADCQLRFCFVFYFLFSALPLPLPAVLWPKMRHTLRRATVRL